MIYAYIRIQIIVEIKTIIVVPVLVLPVRVLSVRVLPFRVLPVHVLPRLELQPFCEPAFLAPHQCSWEEDNRTPITAGNRAYVLPVLVLLVRVLLVRVLLVQSSPVQSTKYHMPSLACFVRVFTSFTSAGCNVCYVGETTRHFSTRVRDHLVIRPLTFSNSYRIDRFHCHAIKK